MIKNCPFCGKRVYSLPNDRWEPKYYHIVCGNCYLKVEGYGENLTEKELLERWNRRVKE